jgi:hypothetical protein
MGLRGRKEKTNNLQKEQKHHPNEDRGPARLPGGLLKAPHKLRACQEIIFTVVSPIHQALLRCSSLTYLGMRTPRALQALRLGNPLCKHYFLTSPYLLWGRSRLS